MNHSFDVGHAVKYGVHEAIFIQNMVFWIKRNQGNERHFFEGKTWTYNSLRAFILLFPYWSERRLRSVIDRLVAEKIIEKRPMPGKDRTNWYSFIDEKAFLTLDIGDEVPKRSNGKVPKRSNGVPKRSNGVPKRSNGGCPNDQMTNTSDTVDSTDTVPDISPPSSKEDLKLETEPLKRGQASPNKRFTDLWCSEYERAHGTKYLFQGAKDGSAVSRLMPAGSPEELVDIAKQAWKKPQLFNCRQAASIAGFASRINDIRLELKNETSPGRNLGGIDRNKGTFNEGCESEWQDWQRKRDSQRIQGVP